MAETEQTWWLQRGPARRCFHAAALYLIIGVVWGVVALWPRDTVSDPSDPLSTVFTAVATIGSLVLAVMYLASGVKHRNMARPRGAAALPDE